MDSGPAESTAGALHRHPTGRFPKSINLVALGPTSSDFHAAQAAYDPIIPEADELWTVNKGFRSINADLVFIMDDLIGERFHSERYYRDICNLDIPVITSIIDAEVLRQYPKATDLVRYPIEQLVDWYGLRLLEQQARLAGSPVIARGMTAQVDKLKPGEIIEVEPGYTVESVVPRPFTAKEIREAGKRIAYFKNSVPLMIAYAGFIGVRKINLFGADYVYPGQSFKEEGRSNCEFWCSIFIGLLGGEIHVSSNTTLMGTNLGRAIYGYGPRQPKL